MRREEHCKQISLACVGMVSVSPPPWAWPHSWRVCFPRLHCSVSRLLCRGTDKAGPGLHVLPRSKSLRFRLFHIPQRHRLLCFLPFSGLSSLGDQVLDECSCPQLEAASYRLPHPSHLVFWVYNRHAFSGVLCVSSRELISGCDPPGGCQPPRIPKSLG